MSPIRTTVLKKLHYDSSLNFNLNVNVLNIPKGFSSSSRSSSADLNKVKDVLALIQEIVCIIFSFLEGDVMV